MSYKVLETLTVVEQIETTGRASVTIDVDGCYGGLVSGSIRVDVTRDVYSEETVYDFKVNTNFNPKESTDIVVALGNFTKALEVVTDTIEYYKENMALLAEAFATFKKSIEAEHAAAKERFQNDTSMFYTAEKEIEKLASAARNGWGKYVMKVRMRGEADRTFEIYAKAGRDNKVRFDRYGYKTSKKAMVREIQDHGAEVISIERY